ncbi:hypothetical protein D3C80_2014900 [compost metagenome]
MGMVLTDQQGQLLAVARRLEALVDRIDQLQAALFMGDMPWPFRFGCGAFAQVM